MSADEEEGVILVSNVARVVQVCCGPLSSAAWEISSAMWVVRGTPRAHEYGGKRNERPDERRGSGERRESRWRRPNERTAGDWVKEWHAKAVRKRRARADERLDKQQRARRRCRRGADEPRLLELALGRPGSREGRGQG